MGSQNNGSMISSSMASSIAVPISKSSAVASYDSLSKTYTSKSKIDFESLPIKYFEKYRIGCLKDGSDVQILAGLGISALNLAGLFTGTNIDYPDHWFLIAVATNWINDIDEMISLSRKIIGGRLCETIICEKLFFKMDSLGENEITNLMNTLDKFSIKKDDLLKKYFEKYQIYSSKIDKMD